MANQRIVIRIHGRVQMVMFRDFVQRKARKLGLSGWVENEDSGTVRVVAEGKKSDLKELIDLCYNGPILAKVSKVDIDWQKATNKLDSFEIHY